MSDDFLPSRHDIKRQHIVLGAEGEATEPLIMVTRKQLVEMLEEAGSNWHHASFIVARDLGDVRSLDPAAVVTTDGDGMGEILYKIGDTITWRDLHKEANG